MAQRSRASKGRKKPFLDKILIVGIALAAITIIFYLFFRPHEKTTRPHRPDSTAKSIRPEQRKLPHEDKARPPARAYVAIVIDDLGQDLRTADELLSLNKDITFAVLPGLPHSAAVAAKAVKNGNEVLVHLPMERKNNKGRPESSGTLHLDMTPMQFLETLRHDIESVTGAVGINNHEGSALTENKEAMKFLMAELKARNLFFLDSLTSPKSTAHTTAKEFGVKSARRDVFLDNDSSNINSIRSQLNEIEAIAKKRGWAIGIGHPHPETISVLKDWIAEAESSGIRIVPVSRLVK